jgi:hypothetical protein
MSNGKVRVLSTHKKWLKLKAILLWKHQSKSFFFLESHDRWMYADLILVVKWSNLGPAEQLEPADWIFLSECPFKLKMKCQPVTHQEIHIVTLSPTMAAASGHSFVHTNIFDNACNSDSCKKRMGYF